MKHQFPLRDSFIDNLDGAGLACAFFEHILSLGEERPKVVSATHYHGKDYELINCAVTFINNIATNFRFIELFENKLLEGHPLIWYGQMKIILDSNVENVEDEVTYLYKLEPGRSSSSFGTW
jgi:DNA mismatch repair protein MSH5